MMFFFGAFLRFLKKESNNNKNNPVKTLHTNVVSAHLEPLSILLSSHAALYSILRVSSPSAKCR